MTYLLPRSSEDLSRSSSSRPFRVCLAAPPSAAASNACDPSSAETSAARLGVSSASPAELASVAQRANDEAVAAARRTLEETLRAKDREIAAATASLTAERARSAALAEREKCLRGRLVVAEETRALYQLSLHRLLDLIRAGAAAEAKDAEKTAGGTALRVSRALAPGAAPLVPLHKVAAAASAALRSAEAATNNEAVRHAMREFTPDGKRRAAGDDEAEEEFAVDQREQEEIPLAPSNAVLLASTMVTASIADCVAVWARAESRREAEVNETLNALSVAVTDAIHNQGATLCAAVSAASTRVDAVHRAVRDAVNRVSHVRLRRQTKTQMEADKKAKAEAKAKAQAEAARARAAAEEERRADSRAAVARIVQHAADALEDTRQCARAAARDMERRALEGHSLNEPFLQSVRAIAIRAEAQAQLARTAIMRAAAPARLEEERNRAYEKMQRHILNPPRRHAEFASAYTPDESVYTAATHGSFGRQAEDSRLLIALEELGRVVANLAQLLDNNARQMDDNATRIVRAIGAWETAVASRMGNIETMMAEALAAARIEEPQRALQLQSQVQAIGYTASATPVSPQKQSHTHLAAFNGLPNRTGHSTAGGVVEASHPALISRAEKFLYTNRTSNATLDSSVPSLSGAGSCVSSIDVARGINAVPPSMVVETAPHSSSQYSPRQRVNGQPPPQPARRVDPLPAHCSPISITVSPTVTPRKAAQATLNYSLSPSEGLSPVSAIATMPRMQHGRRKEADDIREWLPGSRAIVPRRINW